MKIDTHPIGDIVVLDLSGAVFQSANEEYILEDLIKSLARGGFKKIGINLAGCTTLSTNALSMLIRMKTYLEQMGGKLKLFNLQGHAEYVMELTHLHMIFQPCKDEEEMIQAMRLTSASGFAGGSFYL